LTQLRRPRKKNLDNNAAIKRTQSQFAEMIEEFMWQSSSHIRTFVWLAD
jgi:hypothetical protein